MSNSSHGLEDPGNGGGLPGAISFQIQMALARISTCAVVKIEKCTNAGSLSPVGFVDALPLVVQVDGEQNAEPHTTVYGLPYFRLQGGGNAVIIDPQPGDIGIVVFASRDISAVKAKRGQNVPGSGRMFSMSDGLYIGGVLNGTPSQYIQFSGAGVKVFSPTLINLVAPKIVADASDSFTVNSPQSTFSGAVTVQGLFTFLAGLVGSAKSGAAAVITGAVNFIGALTSNGKDISSGHTHKGVQPGSGNTGDVN